MKRKLMLFLLFFAISTTLVAQDKKKYQLSSHLLNVAKGFPASGVSVDVFKQASNGEWGLIKQKVSNKDGRVENLLDLSQDNRGVYKFRIYNEKYQKKLKAKTVLPYIDTTFKIFDDSYYHLTILLSGNGYSINGYRYER